MNQEEFEGNPSLRVLLTLRAMHLFDEVDRLPPAQRLPRVLDALSRLPSTTDAIYVAGAALGLSQVAVDGLPDSAWNRYEGMYARLLAERSELSDRGAEARVALPSP